MRMMAIIKTENRSGRLDNDIEGVIIHFTAGGDIDGIIRWFKNPISRASAHYVISRSGRLVQMVEDGYAAWHAGSSSTVPMLNGRKNLNLWTIGIEICNWGYLLKSEVDCEVPCKIDGNIVMRKRKKGAFYNHFYNWTYPYTGPKPEYHPIESNIPLLKVPEECDSKLFWPKTGLVEFWEPYTENQYEVLIDLLRDLKLKYNIDKEFVAGHQDVDPTRKLDPGPAFNFKRVIDKVYDDRIVLATKGGTTETVDVNDVYSCSDHDLDITQ